MRADRSVVVRVPENGAEAARVAQPQRLPADDDVHVVVPARRRVRRDTAEAARGGYFINPRHGTQVLDQFVRGALPERK